ncbi:hypothetical protein [Xylanibacter rodentium]|uniref:hypothetical protein n=1 Tax=Xylanibacter rodentium TaxID=2736289 RepID=UPI00258C00E6|nr:hypothetical protein [Xylanibacter rodentium]
MVNVITELSRYAMTLFLALYTLLGFQLVRRQEEEKRAALRQQDFLLFFLLLMGNLILYLNTGNEKVICFCGVQLLMLSLWAFNEWRCIVNDVQTYSKYL